MADAVRAYSISQPIPKVLIVTWTGIDSDDSGVPFVLPHWANNISVQVTGTFGAGGTLIIEGTNMESTPTYTTLNDELGSALSFTATRLAGFDGIPYALRPRATAGDGTTALAVRLRISA